MWSCTPATSDTRGRSTSSCSGGTRSRFGHPAARIWRSLSADGVGGGIVQCPTPHPLWLPYVNVEGIGEVTERARLLGGRVLLEPREGPAGWRSVVAAPWAGEIALWEAKR